ncbi:accessory Sec system protein Asp2 [Leuconostoc litchii]|uniref:Accessory Sec system protein Asp2 n=1 Tax=Leuconostoc litchii TaxID=1981069 RepID=A0A6P2CLK0_9LACO|nr:accessory Sec system protein Asp2 [Leuconostoc litchii]TYC46166.1 accessory Sec system protein Asp2 [Leuconostoc litchii]GMA70384.1 accessory Sec system protein Asp2 [Leuconostoc litchii]
MIKIINVDEENIFENSSNDQISFQFMSWKQLDTALNNNNKNLSFSGEEEKESMFPDYILLSQINQNDVLTENIVNKLLKKHWPIQLLYDISVTKNQELLSILNENRAIKVDLSDINYFLEEAQKYLFNGQEGSKLSVGNTLMRRHQENQLNILGHVNTVFEGIWGQQFKQIYTWRYNYIFQENKVIELWLEYESEQEVEIILNITRISSDGQNIIQTTSLSETDLQNPYVITSFNPGEYLSASVSARGKGQVKLGQLHIRRSRKALGTFFVGGKRIVSENRQELMTYFHPGDRKPPLNVYFSGYRSAEGFEGNFMMRDLSAPYLLVTDPRLEGGSFYMGKRDIGENLIQTIKSTLKELDFTESQLVLSGLSMGTFGALYYAADLQPHAVIIGKPLVNIGDVAYHEHTIRPNMFPTALDMLLNIAGESNVIKKENVNNRFWNKFTHGNYQNTKFCIAFMRNDDYDPMAFKNIQKFCDQKGIPLLSKGFVGRHNDNSYAINSWFIKQYKNILQYDFGRAGTVE